MMKYTEHKKGVQAMAMKIPERLKKMLEHKAYGHVITYNAKGKPEITMVWMDIDGDEPPSGPGRILEQRRAI